MATNNFKLLEEDAEKQFPHAPEEIENNLMGNMRMTHFVGNVVELYLPRIFDIILTLFGGSPKEGNKMIRNENLTNDSDDAPWGSPKSDL